MAAHLPRNSPETPKKGCATPVKLPRISPETPAQLRCATPSLPKGREYSVPPSGVRHKPVLASAEIEALAQRVQRLMVSHRDPERFFIDRSDIAGDMRRLARLLR